MDRDTIWRHTHAERHAMAETLAGLTSEQWDAPSVCAGWSVKDVAVHVISHPQLGWTQMPGMFVRNLGRGYNALIFREVKRRSAGQTPQSILDDFERLDGSTRKVPVTTTLEPLMDVLVHHQDVLRALGLHHDMDPEAARAVADRSRLLSFLSGSRDVVRSVRMVATDVDWERGKGPTLSGPVQELLLVCMGRARVARDLEGEGLGVIAHQHARPSV